MLKDLNRIDLLRKVSYLYFLVFVILSFFNNTVGIVGNSIIFLLGLIFLIQMIYKGNKADLVIGVLLALGSFYLLLAVTSDLIDYYNGTKPLNNFAEYFGFGYGIMGSATTAAIIIIYSFYYRRRRLENKKALHA